MPQVFPHAASNPDREYVVDLKQYLLRRITLFALAICLIGIGVILYQAREQIREHIERTGSTIGSLIAGEAIQPRGSFQFGLEGMELASLDRLGELLGICVAVEDTYNRPVVRRCFAEASNPPAIVRGALGLVMGTDIQYRGAISQYPGYKVGEFVVTPNLDTEALAVWHEIRTVLGMTIGILALNLFIYLPVRRALLPAEQILAVLARMQSGDLAVRMPRPRLIELRRIAAGFDHLTERLRKTMAEHRHLAQRLLAVREEERRHLARELHDEFGQCLTSIGADAGFIAARARNVQPELLPAVHSIATVTAGMMESLQGILSQLRPAGLEEFGLQVGLEQLVAGWQRRLTDCSFDLIIEGEIDNLPDDLTVNLYRIVQESLTNALRHSLPDSVTVRLVREEMHCMLCIEDNGEGRSPTTAGSGLGILGMNERVVALGGRFAVAARSPRGMRVLAEFPADAMRMRGGHDA